MTHQTARTYIPCRSTDRGSVLPLVLVFVIALSLVVGALLTYTSTALRSSDVTDQSISRLTAAESAMQYALGEAAADPVGSCDGSPRVRGPLNNAAVTTTCWRQAELENLDGLYAVVLTGEGPGAAPVTQTALDINGADSTAGVKDILGPIFIGSPGGNYLTLSPVNGRALLPDPSAPGAELGGVVKYQPKSGTCPEPTAPVTPAAWDGTPKRPPTVNCLDKTWNDVAPDLDFFTSIAPDAVNLASATAAAPTVDPSYPNCDIYEPGRYPTPPNITRPSYFRSGVYYFASGLLEIDDLVVAGKRSPDSFFPTSAAADLSTECAGLWNGVGEDDTGAVWILGGDARIRAATNSQLNVYGRAFPDIATPVNSADRAIIALTAAQASALSPTFTVTGVTLPINGDVSPTPPKLIDRQNGGNASMSFYGQVYAPNSWVDTGNAASNVFVEFLGGIVAGRLTVRTAANVDGFNISVPTSVQNVFYIESAAVSASGTAATVRTRSIEQVDATSGDRTLNVDSWRVCERGAC